MKEKIKNFLLKIKNFFNEKFVCTRFKLIFFALIVSFITCLINMVNFTFTDYCFNETHTEQIEETPQTESMRIEKDLKFVNPTQSDYVVPSNDYYFLYLNQFFNDYLNVFSNLTFYDVSSLGLEYDIYPIYCFDNSNVIRIVWLEKHNATTYSLVFCTNVSAREFVTYARFGVGNLSFINNVIDTNFANATPLTSLYGLPIGTQNQLLYNFVSYIPFEINSTPTLENAPSSLVNTIPSNAVTTLPSNLGTKVYDSGSSTYNQKNIFGYQLYFKSYNGFRFDTDSTLINNLSVQFDNFYYAYYIEEIYLVLYGLWNNNEIYYVSDNLVDVVGTFNTKVYDQFNFINAFETINTINTYYNDYNLVYVDVSLIMQTINTNNNHVFDIASYSDYGFEFLIPTNIDLFSYGNKSHNLDIIYELDRNFVELFNISKNMTLNDIKSNTFNEIYNSAFNRGTESGYNTGYDNGYFLGESNGRLEGFENGYNEGFEIGSIDGYESGYIDGNNAGISSQAPLNPIMDFIADGALVISNVFSFEILPNLTLGTLLLFPLVISLIWFIIKLFMGG